MDIGWIQSVIGGLLAGGIVWFLEHRFNKKERMTERIYLQWEAAYKWILEQHDNARTAQESWKYEPLFESEGQAHFLRATDATVEVLAKEGMRDSTVLLMRETFYRRFAEELLKQVEEQQRLERLKRGFEATPDLYSIITPRATPRQRRLNNGLAKLLLIEARMESYAGYFRRYLDQPFTLPRNKYGVVEQEKLNDSAT